MKISKPSNKLTLDDIKVHNKKKYRITVHNYWLAKLILGDNVDKEKYFLAPAIKFFALKEYETQKANYEEAKRIENLEKFRGLKEGDRIILKPHFLTGSASRNIYTVKIITPDKKYVALVRETKGRKLLHIKMSDIKLPFIFGGYVKRN
jgi:hypothetical protein